MQKCSCCKLIKFTDDFYANKAQKSGLQNDCKMCHNKSVRKWIDRNKAKHNQYNKTTKKRMRINNSELVNAELTKWRKSHVDLVRIYCRDAYKKRRESLKFRLSCAIRGAIRRSFQGSKPQKTFDMLGFGLEELKAHLESQFQSGMTWENYGEWHIDHKIPISAFNFDSPEQIDFKRCWSLENLQPMWARENMSKGAKILKQFQPMLRLESA